MVTKISEKQLNSIFIIQFGNGRRDKTYAYTENGRKCTHILILVIFRWRDKENFIFFSPLFSVLQTVYYALLLL